MKMKVKSIIALSAICAISFTSCKDDFADINTNPAVVVKPDVKFLVTQGILNFEPSGYTYWFYNAANTHQWSQAFVPTSGFGDNFNIHGPLGSQGEQNIDVRKVYRDIEHELSLMQPQEAAKYSAMKSVLKPLMVYLGLFDTDMFGDMPYIESCLAKYTNPMLLTPKYDKIEDLYDLWMKELDESINAFGASGQYALDNGQDVVYQGNFKKWAKFSNTLKLKIAARLINVNKSKALSIVEEAAKNPAGLIISGEDDFLFSKMTAGSMAYHFGEDVSSGAASNSVVNLLLKNRDPRVRFFYSKNDYNSIVVQGFFDLNKPLPAFIESNVEYSIDGAGKKHFVRWKGVGEPWIRYYGIPTEYNAGKLGQYADYFDSNRWKLKIKKDDKDFERTYVPYSLFQEELVRGDVDYTYPELPGAAVTEDKQDNPWYGMYMSAAETNLYLAEFSLLGANLPNTAEYYYNKGVELSVITYDKLAGLNKIPYYYSKYDDKEELIGLKSGEINAMMNNDDYKLTGSLKDKLEKVYIQQYLHFMYQPNDQFVGVRRSGVPMVGSSILSWNHIKGNSTEIPRRYDISSPSPTDLMYNIKIDVAKRQGFSFGVKQTPSVLNSERVWQDKGAPNFGEGPKL